MTSDMRNRVEHEGRIVTRSEGRIELRDVSIQSFTTKLQGRNFSTPVPQYLSDLVPPVRVEPSSPTG